MQDDELPFASWTPQQMPTLLLGRIARSLARRVDDGLRPLGLTSAQLPVLVALKHGDQLTQKELAESIGVEQPSMAQLLSRMERDGLIRRSPSPSDGRSSLVSLTDLATSRLEPGRAVLRDLDEAVCSVLTREDRNMLTRLLLTLNEHVK